MWFLFCSLVSHDRQFVSVCEIKERERARERELGRVSLLFAIFAVYYFVVAATLVRFAMLA